MKKTLISISLILIASSLFLPTVQATGQASVALSPLTASYKVGQTFSLTIVVNPSGETIDTVRAKLNFPPDKLEIQSFSFGPKFTFQAGGNGHDNAAGTFSYGAGVANGTADASLFGTIVFKAKGEGQAAVNLTSDSLVLSAGESKFNGLGSSASFSILPVPPAPAPPQATPKTDITQPSALEPTPSETANPQETQPIQVLTPEPEAVSRIAAIFSGVNLAVAIGLAALLIALVVFIVLKKRNNQSIGKINY
jgi:hypothetical protein